MSRLFLGAKSFDADISKWDVSRVKDMRDMFLDASSFNGDLEKWDVSNVKDMSGMFSGANFFKRKLCGTAWIHSNAKKTSMFAGSSGSISEEPCNGACARTNLEYITPTLCWNVFARHSAILFSNVALAWIHIYTQI